jgi:hypothetical protein
VSTPRELPSSVVGQGLVGVGGRGSSGKTRRSSTRRSPKNGPNFEPPNVRPTVADVYSIGPISVAVSLSLLEL